MANSEKKSLVVVRAYPGTSIPDCYINLVKSRWIRTYRRDNDFMKMTYAPSYYANYNAYIQSLLQRPKLEVRFAVLAEDTDVVLGFSVLERDVLHYVHVPKAYRKKGIAGLLVPKDISWATHITKIGLRIWPKWPKVKLDPFR